MQHFEDDPGRRRADVGNLPQRAVRLQVRFDRLLQRQDRVRRALVAPHALLRFLDRGEVAQQGGDLAVHIHARGGARHPLILSPVSEPIVANPRPAATVVVLRDSSSGPEVFMVRRHADTAFMGGAHVFPGGRVDQADHDGDEAWCDGIAHAARAAAGPAAWQTRSPTTSPPRASCSRKPACCSPATPAAPSFRSPAPRTTSASSRIAPTVHGRQDDAACRRRTRTAAPRARHAGAVRALGDAADRHPPVRHALLHDPRAAAPDAGARRHRDDAQRLDRRRPRRSRSRSAATSCCRRRPGARSASSSRFSRSTTRSTGHAAAASSAGSRCCSSRTACACCSRPATRSTPNPADDEPLAETRFVFVDGRWRPERAR